MAGKPNTKWLETMVAKLGSVEAVREHQRQLGSKGGKNGTTGGFAWMKANGQLDKVRACGAVGGRISRRTKNVSQEA